MDAYESLVTRRSIRYYKKQKVEEEKVEKILRAAMQAPSARNYQPWHFIILDEEKTLEAVGKLHPYGDILRRAPLGILICGDLEKENTIDYLVEDCSAATENILIGAHSLDLGACWLGIYPREKRVQKIKEYFNLPEQIIPISLVATGYPAEEKKLTSRFKESRIYYNGWKKNKSGSK